MDSTANIGENSRAAAILESLGVASILINLDNVVTHLNEQAALILGVDREEILGRPFYDLEDDNSHYLNVRAALRRALGYPGGEEQTSFTKKFSLQAAQKQVGLRTRVGTALDCYGDPVKLSWMLSTLIANTVSFTPEGGSVEVSAGRDEQALRMSVSDSGPGIPLELCDVILEQHPQRKPEGLDNGSPGLSLAIAKEIVEAHAGRIVLDSSTKGTTFVIQLPRSRSI